MTLVVFFLFYHYCVCMMHVCMDAGTHVGGNQKTTLESQFTPRLELT